jgi:hypothetical protein
MRCYRLPGFLSIGFVAAASLAATLAATPAERTPEWVARRVQQWQPNAAERRWESIGWARDIRQALRLAQQHRRPVFLFTLDGRMNLGRC